MRCRQEFSFRASCSFGFSLTKGMINNLHSKLYVKSMPIEIFKKQSRRHVTLSGEVPGVSRVVVLLGPKPQPIHHFVPQSLNHLQFAVPYCSSLEFFAYPHSSLERNPYHESSSLASLADPQLFRFLFSFISHLSTRGNPSYIQSQANAIRPINHRSDWRILNHHTFLHTAYTHT